MSYWTFKESQLGQEKRKITLCIQKERRKTINAQRSTDPEEDKWTNHIASFGYNVREERSVTRWPLIPLFSQVSSLSFSLLLLPLLRFSSLSLTKSHRSCHQRDLYMMISFFSWCFCISSSFSSFLFFLFFLLSFFDEASTPPSWATSAPLLPAPSQWRPRCHAPLVLRRCATLRGGFSYCAAVLGLGHLGLF